MTLPPREREVPTFDGNRRLVRELVGAGARFLVVGGSAMLWYFSERQVGNNDLDLLVEDTPENAARVVSAVNALGFAGDTFTPERFSQRQNTLVRLNDGMTVLADLLTRCDLPFPELWAEATDGLLLGHPVKVASPATLWLMLEESAESKHIADRELLKPLVGDGGVDHLRGRSSPPR